MADDPKDAFKPSGTRTNVLMAPHLPVEIVHDIICYTLSSFYWSYFVNGQIIYRRSPLNEIKLTHKDEDGQPDREKRVEWDPITAMAGINVIFRDQTIRIASKALSIPRAVNGSLLEHPRKVTARIYLLRHHLNPDPGHSEYQEQSQPGIPHPLLDTSQSVPTYFPNIPSPSHNPWTNSPNLVIYVHRLLESGYISHSVFLKAYVSLLVGKSALETLSFGEVVRTGLGLRADNQPAEGEATDGRNEALMALQIMGEKSPAAWALEMMNRIIPPLTVWVPKQMCSHLMHGLFSVAYSLHTISAICGIVGVVTSCTKLMIHLRAVESIAGIDEDRRRSLQTATRACTMSLQQLQKCESGSYSTYKALGVPSHPPPWPNHIIPHNQILDALKLAGPEDLFPLPIRFALLRAAIIWRFRVEVPGLDLVFPDQLLNWKKGLIPLSNAAWLPQEERESQRVWGGLDCGHWEGTREEFLEMWMKFEDELTNEFKLQGVAEVEEEIEL